MSVCLSVGGLAAANIPNGELAMPCHTWMMFCLSSTALALASDGTTNETSRLAGNQYSTAKASHNLPMPDSH